PKHIDVDVSGLKLNESIHVTDITVADTLKVLTDPETVLFLVKLHEEKIEETPADPQEVEVLTEKKEEETPAAGAEKGKEEPKAAEKTVKPEKK
ncbi:MAG: hypothetical protein HYZ87_04530, partial [Candidatus Omnitrophica bacterium]|nr:hypothetical protein [Candidatus Omnitrophota bacterium]